MVTPTAHGLKGDDALNQEECDNNNLADFLVNFDFGLWPNLDALCDKYILRTIGEVANPKDAYSIIRSCFEKLLERKSYHLV
jgi:hypothetical protein